MAERRYECTASTECYEVATMLIGYGPGRLSFWMCQQHGEYVLKTQKFAELKKQLEQ